MVSQVAELHDDFSDTIFSVTKDQLHFGNTFKFYIPSFFHRLITSIGNTART
jgi:hypothetical protein